MNNKKHILIIAYGFPPNPAIGARRIAKIAEELISNGWVPHIVTSNDNHFKFKAKTSVSDKLIYKPRWSDPWKYALKIDNILNIKIVEKLVKLIFPFGSDRRLNFWITSATKEALNIIENNNIEAIYSTFSPKQNLIVANRVKKENKKIVWINEYRDLWTGNPYHEKSLVSNIFNKYKEKKIIKSTDGLVTVSQPLADELIELHNKETVVIYNGYDEFSIENKSNDNKFIISYTGTIYKGKRDPKPLFEALQIIKYDRLDIYNNLSVNLYGPSLPRLLLDNIRSMDIGDIVFVKDSIPHTEAVEVQKKSDILLLLGWNNIKEKGVVTGKLFEYLGRGKPILGITYEHGSVQEILQQTGLGNVYNSPTDIAKFIIDLYTKKQNKYSFEVNIDKVSFFSRKNQVKLLSNFIKKIINDL